MVLIVAENRGVAVFNFENKNLSTKPSQCEGCLKSTRLLELVWTEEEVMGIKSLLGLLPSLRHLLHSCEVRQSRQDSKMWSFESHLHT